MESLYVYMAQTVRDYKFTITTSNKSTWAIFMDLRRAEVSINYAHRQMAAVVSA